MSNMKMALAAMMAAVSLPLAARAEPACTELVITGHPANPPVTWASGGAIVGAAPERVALVARDLGVARVVSRDFGSWEAVQRAARRGQVDVIAGIYKNEARTRYLHYVEPPFMADPVVVAVRRGEGFGFKKWQDLKARRGVATAGESRGDRFDDFMKSELTVFRVPGVEQAFAALLNIEADYLIVGLYQGRDEARRLGIEEKVDFLPIKLETADVYLAFSKKSACYKALGSRFAARLEAAVRDGRARGLLESAEKQLER
ncbi:MAG TPA: transporter substrate-binding domain-containing protein [Thiobacillaceae bacterium]